MENKPKHVRPSLLSVNPVGHSHLKLPMLLTHKPFKQTFFSHSSISLKIESVELLLTHQKGQSERKL
jgi:hypothetical protein